MEKIHVALDTRVSCAPLPVCRGPSPCPLRFRGSITCMLGGTRKRVAGSARSCLAAVVTTPCLPPEQLWQLWSAGRCSRCQERRGHGWAAAVGGGGAGAGWHRVLTHSVPLSLCEMCRTV